MQAQMEKLFSDMMTNVTEPGAFKTQRRGVLSGEAMFARIPAALPRVWASRPDLRSSSPPSTVGFIR
ncbi:MAG: conjugal transfer protein TraH [Hyphomicrobiales bacterium]